MLKLEIPRYYKMKAGQTLKDVARTFCVAERLLVVENGLCAPPECGFLLRIPTERGNAYIAKAGDSKTLLCGCDENFARKNGTDILYPGMRVIL